jgi:poly-gamma-glutamate capsule biosynthesis protein CapA/YwtB (metallophosphatase superfamily)
MPYPDDLNGDVFRRMEESEFNFSKVNFVDFHAVFATESNTDQIAKMDVADFKAREQLTNIEARPYPGV